MGRRIGGEQRGNGHAAPGSGDLIGLIAGALVALSVEWLELWLQVDDPGGAISAHACRGIMGVVGGRLLCRMGSRGAPDNGWRS